MSRQADEAVSEVVSFILILVLITAGVAITVAVITPELQKSQTLQHQAEAVAAFSDLKVGIDQLWIFDKSEIPASLLLHASGTLTLSSTPLTFNHSSGKTSANLLTVSYIEEPKNRLTYEAGSLFFNQQLLLKHSTGDTHAVLTCVRDQNQTTITTNSPILFEYLYHHANTYTNVTSIQITNSLNNRYWQNQLEDIQTITLIDCTITMRAVS